MCSSSGQCVIWLISLFQSVIFLLFNVHFSLLSFHIFFLIPKLAFILSFFVIFLQCSNAKDWLTTHQRYCRRSLGVGRKQAPEKAMAPHSSVLPGKSHGWRSLVGCSPWGRWGSTTTERLHFHFSFFTFMRWRRKWQPTPVFLPGESQGQGSLVGCHLWGCTELDTTEVT